MAITLNRNKFKYKNPSGSGYRNVDLLEEESKVNDVQVDGTSVVTSGVANIDLSGKADKTGTVLDTTLSRGRKANTTVGTASIAFGDDVAASGNYSQAFGRGSVASGLYSFAEGYNVTASSSSSHAEGQSTKATGLNSHAEGFNTIASASSAHAEGGSTVASNGSAHAEGAGTVASGDRGSHAEGEYSKATGIGSHAEGSYTEANGYGSHAEGLNTIANARGSHVEGMSNVPDSYYDYEEWVPGKQYEVGDKVTRTYAPDNVQGFVCTVANNASTWEFQYWKNTMGTMHYAHIVGNGEYNSPSNAYALDWEGNGKYAGDVYVHANADSTGGSKLARESIIAPTEATTATSAHAIGDKFILDGQLCKAIAAIAVGDTIATTGISANAEVTQIVDELGSGGASSLAELTDAAIDTPSDGQILKYDGTAEKWKNADAISQQDIADAVGDWLDDHVDPDTGYVIDDTLSIAGAAADAKAAGDEIADLKSAITQLDGAVEELEQGSLSALGATAGQVPMANGDGTWEWAGVKGMITIQDPAALQRLAASGQAGKFLEVGNVIYIPWTNYTPSTPVQIQFPFVVANIADCYDENGVKHENAVWLQAMYAQPEEIQFDAAEDYTVNLSEEPNALEGWYYWGVSGTTYTALNLTAGTAIPTTYDSVHKCKINDVNVMRYGYNRWKDSAYRQWLNSDAAKNANWWTSQHAGDVAPTTTYTNKPGWLYGFSKKWLDIIKPVKVQTSCNTVTDGGVTDTTYDKFFLPSLEEVYGNPQIADVEGPYWPYWKEETGLESPSNGSSSDTNNARKIPQVTQAPNGGAVGCRLRSASRGYSNGVWDVGSAGWLSTHAAYLASRAFPACVIY